LFELGPSIAHNYPVQSGQVRESILVIGQQWIVTL
jgi:hypothetical protein